jgi:hypothetical protein
VTEANPYEICLDKNAANYVPLTARVSRREPRGRGKSTEKPGATTHLPAL